MKWIHYTSLLLLYLLNTGQLLSQATLTVLDPQRWGSNRPGTIEEASVTLRPAGIYTEVGLFLTFSARDVGYGAGDLLEVVLDFHLPEEAIVHDSWLWIGDTIVKADIYDRWTASGIYEDIVNRRKDPSILYKNSDGVYQLRVFPMAGDQSRRVRIGYLLPNNWTADAVLSSLPVDIWRASHRPLDKVLVRAWLEGEWQDPRFLEGGLPAFTRRQNPELGNFWETEVPMNAVEGAITFALDNPSENGIYVNHFPDEKIYQMAFSPKEAFNLSNPLPQKIVVLFDYLPEHSRDISQQDLLNNVEQHLRFNMTDRDSFNIIVNRLNPKPVIPIWLPADSATLSLVFSGLGQHPIAEYDNLPGLLSAGIEFIRDEGGEGVILLFSNSGKLGGDHVSNNHLISDILVSMGDRVVPVFIGDYQQVGWNSYYVGNRLRYGNEYLFVNLSRQTGGAYFHFRGNQGEGQSVEPHLNSLVGNTVGASLALRGTLDLYTTLENGFCFSRFSLGADNGSFDLSQPILHVGKYEGEFPFVIEVAGIYSDRIFSDAFILEEDKINEADTLAQEIWAGNYIRLLEQGNQSNDRIAEIIGRSLADRVLSRYTAFISLEPELGGEPCLDCIDEGEDDVAVSVDGPSPRDSLLSITAFPNPFRERLTVQVEFPGLKDTDKIRLAIFNTLGQQVNLLYASEAGQRGEMLRWEWDGRDQHGRNLPGGIYFLSVQSVDKRITHKILYLPH